MSGFDERTIERAIRASKVNGKTPTMTGRVLFIDRGIQTIRTDSLMCPIVKCIAGRNAIPGARPGDKVSLWYRVDLRRGFAGWFGRVL
jgi:hypothetical protein